MSKGYKVRLGDGSEIGPMDLQAVKDWFVQGLINRDSPVLKPGAGSWKPLSDVLDLRDVRRPSTPQAPRAQISPATFAPAKRAKGRASASDEEEEAYAEAGTGAWRTVVAGILFFLAAAGAGSAAFVPNRWLPALDGTPWKEIALGQLVFGLLLVRGWEIGRKIVRVLVLLLGFVLFPLAGILVAQGVRGRALLVVASAWLLASGFFALLSGASLSVPKTVLSLVLILAGAVGVPYFGWIPENPDLKKIREWAGGDRRFGDADLGLVLNLPSGWILLREGQPLVVAPLVARPVLAQERLGGFGFVVAESSPRGVWSLDEYLARVLETRKKSLSSYREAGRADVLLGKLTGRQVVGSWDTEGAHYRDVTIAAKDGWQYVALAAWVPDDGTSRPAEELEALVKGLALTGEKTPPFDAAVEKLIRDVPHLSALAAEMVMGQSAAHVLEPDQAFRKGHELASRGLAALTPAEVRELGDLTSAASAALPSKDRKRLSAYYDRIRDRFPTTPEDDREMSGLMKGAVLRLPAERRSRLQALYEKAIRAALTG